MQPKPGDGIQGSPDHFGLHAFCGATFRGSCLKRSSESGSRTKFCRARRFFRDGGSVLEEKEDGTLSMVIFHSILVIFLCLLGGVEVKNREIVYSGMMIARIILSSPIFKIFLELWCVLFKSKF